MTSPSKTEPVQNRPLAILWCRYALYVVLVVVLYWAPILAFGGHPFSDQLIQSAILLMVVVASPLNHDYARHLRWWIRLPLAAVLAGSILVGHVYVAYDVMGHERTHFDYRWAALMLIYVIAGAWGLQKLILDRAHQTSTES